MQRIKELIRKSDSLKHPGDRFPNPIYEEALTLLQEKDGDILVVQVGAFDGVTDDDLYPFLHRNKHWSGILFEPMFVPFHNLKEAYEYRPNLIFEMKAIALREGTMQAWNVPYEERGNPDLPRWATGCTTLIPNCNPLFGYNCEQEEYQKIMPFVTLGLVETTILPKALKQHGIERIDVFHVDAEGMDWDIIRQINFDKYKPQIIHYEVSCMDADQNGECTYFLNAMGYRLYKYRECITAISEEVDHDRIEGIVRVGQ